MTLDPQLVAANLAVVRERIAEAAARAGRDPGGVELLAATKYVEPDDMPSLAEAGVTLVGENRTDALVAKQARFADAFTWDFIGALQSRKARELVGRVRLVHAVDSVSACEQLQRRSEAVVACLLEINIAGEAGKAGVDPAAAGAFLESVEPLERVHFEGLMTMPPATDDPERSRRHFDALRRLGERLAAGHGGRHAFERLSMGTSQDYAVAVEEGATIVRLGSVLYGRSAG